MKRIIAFLMTVSMLGASLAMPVYAAKESEDVAFTPGMEYAGTGYTPEEEVKYSENSGSVSYVDVSDYSAVGILGMLDIMTGAEEGKFKPNAYISRAEFVEGVLKAFKVRYEGSEFGKDGSFYDVDKEHPQYSAIASALSAGFISGYGNNSFKPDSVMSYEEALSCLLKAIGYSGRAGDNITSARSYLTKGISVKEPKAITRMEMAQLLYNALNIPVRSIPQYSSVGLFKFIDDEYFDSDENRTILTYVWGVYKSAGFLTTNYIETTDDNKPQTGSVVIAGIRYYTNDLNNLDWLGVYVDYYYDDDDNLVYMNKNGKTTEKTIAADDIIGFDPSSKTITYYTEKGRKEKVELDSEYQLFYNGKKPTSFYGKDIFDIEEGQIKLVSYKEEKCKYVFIEEYRNFVLNKVDKNTAELDFKLGENRGHFTINTNTAYITAYDSELSRKEIYRETEDGQSTLDSSVFKSDSIISVFLPYGSYSDDGMVKAGVDFLKIVVSDKSVSGKITASSSKNGTKLTINNEEYGLSKSTYLDTADIRIGDTKSFALDYSGELVAIKEDTSSDEWEFCYLVHITYGDLMEYITELTIFDSYGSFSKVPVSENFRINGKKLKSGEGEKVLKNSAALLGKAGLEYQQPLQIKYSGDGDSKQIAEIRTVLNDYAGISDSWIKREDSGSYRIYYDSCSVICSANTNKKDALYDAPTLILTVPETELKEERYFSSQPISNSSGEIILDIYNVSEDLKPQLAIKYASAAQDSPIVTGNVGSKPVMLKESWTDLGDGDVPILRFSVAQAKGVTEYWSDNVNILDGYVPGDIMILYGNQDKVTKIVPVLYNGKTLGPNNLPTDVSDTERLSLVNAGDYYWYVFQPYKQATSSYMVVQNGPIVDGTKRQFQYLGVTRGLAAMQGGMQIYEEENGKITVGQPTLDQIRYAQDYGDDASIIIAPVHEGGLKQLFVYNLDK